MLFAGPDGVGKKTVAFLFAMAANCVGIHKSANKKENLYSENGVFPNEPCGICKNCRQFYSGNFPDFIRIEPEGQVTKIVQIRELRQLISMKPYGARLRVVLITKAHTLNPEASNALLKILEEPPDRTILILVTLRISDLLPTIVSRCQNIRFNPIPVKLLGDKLAQDLEINPKEAEFLALMANGSFSRALALKNSNRMFLRDWIIKKIENLNTGFIPEILAVAEKMAKSKDKESVHDMLEIMKTWYRDLIISKYCPDKVIHKDLITNIRNISSRYTQHTLMAQISAVQQAQREIDANVNTRLVLENLFLTLAEPAGNNN